MPSHNEILMTNCSQDIIDTRQATDRTHQNRINYPGFRGIQRNLLTQGRGYDCSLREMSVPEPHDAVSPIALDASDVGPPVQVGELPPEYEENHDVEDNIISPVNLILSNHHVVPHDTTDPSPQPLYELSRGVAVLSEATKTVTFSRLERAVRKTSEGNPMVKVRKRHIYDLEHNKAPLFANYIKNKSLKDCPPYWCRSASKRTRGDVGLQAETKFLSSTASFKAAKVGRNGGEYGEPVFLKDVKGRQSQAVFDIEWIKKAEVYLWKDSAGTEVAIETATDTVHKLEVTREMKREDLDIMVALWCLRIWRDSATKQEQNKHDGIDGGKINFIVYS